MEYLGLAMITFSIVFGIWFIVSLAKEAGTERGKGMFFLLVFFACTLLISINAHAGDVEYHKESNTIFYTGTIEQGDSMKIQDAFIQSSTGVRLAVSSGGGLVFEALQISMLIRMFETPVVVFGTCYSACSFLFFASPNKMIFGYGVEGISSQVGIHVPYTETGEGAFPDDLGSVMYWELSGSIYSGIKDSDLVGEIMEVMYSTPPREMHDISERALIKMGTTFIK